MFAAALLGVALFLAQDDPIFRIQRTIQQGDLAQARRLTQEALVASPDDPRLYNFLGVVQAQQRDIAAAESSFLRAIAKAPRFTGAYLNLGRLYQEHSSPRKALETYQRLLLHEPRHVEALYQAAWLSSQTGQPASALLYLDRLPQADRERTPALLLRCASLAAAGRLGDAKAVAPRLLARSDVTEADVTLIVPMLLAHKGETIAVSLLEKVVQTASPSPRLLLQLARIAHQTRDRKGALGYLAHARDLEPRNPEVHFFFGIVCVEMELPLEAKDSLTEAVKLDPENPRYNYALGAVLLQARNADGAIPHFQKFVKARPSDPRGRLALGIAYFHAARHNDASAEFEAAAKHSQTRAGASLFLGRLAVQEGAFAKAEQLFRLAVQANPSLPDAHAELGLAYIRRKEYALAERSLARALQLAPTHVQAHLNRLRLYRMTNDPRAGEQANRVDELQKLEEEQGFQLLRRLDIRPHRDGG